MLTASQYITEVIQNHISYSYYQDFITYIRSEVRRTEFDNAFLNTAISFSGPFVPYEDDHVFKYNNPFYDVMTQYAKFEQLVFAKITRAYNEEKELAKYQHHLDNWTDNGGSLVKKYRHPKPTTQTRDWNAKEVLDIIRVSPDEDNITLYNRIRTTGPQIDFEIFFQQIMETRFPHLVRMAIGRNKYIPLFEALPVLSPKH